jgi:hypothetical protein
MLNRKRNFIIYASTPAICSSVEYLNENLFEVKKIGTQNKNKLNGKHKI